MSKSTKNNMKNIVKTGSVKSSAIPTTNWNLLFKDNKQAVKAFASGDLGLRSMINLLKSEEARTEAYRLERHTTAATARLRAKKALSRNR